MATTKLKFYRGLKARYDAASKHLDAIYFATDILKADLCSERQTLG